MQTWRGSKPEPHIIPFIEALGREPCRCDSNEGLKNPTSLHLAVF